MENVNNVGNTNPSNYATFNITSDNFAYKILLDNDNGGIDFKNVSSVDITDYFTINTIAAGATTLATVDTTVVATAHLNLDADGNILLRPTPAGRITLQENDGTVWAPTQSSDATTKAYVDTNMYHFIRVGFYSTSTSKLFMPMPGAEDMREVTSVIGAGERICFICPFDGSLETVWARSEYDAGDVDIGYHLSATTLEAPSSTATQTVTIDMAVDDTSYEFDFASAGTNTFSQGNIIMFSVEPEASMGDVHFMIVLKFDVST